MNIQTLQAQHRKKASEARAIYREITKDTPEAEARKLGREFDMLITEADEIRDKIEDERDRIADNQAVQRAAHGADMTANGADSGLGEHSEAFVGFLKAPQSRQAQVALDQFETRTASGLTGAAGGYVVPEEIVTPIMARARDANPFRSVVKVINVSTGDIKLPLSNSDATSGWVGETDTRTATTEPTLDSKTPTFGINYSYVKMTEELASDAIINIQNWFTDEAGKAIGEAEMNAILNGDGTKKPTGMLDTAPESGDDGARTANAFKYLEAASATAVTADEMLDLIYDLKAGYRANGRWLMNSSTVGAVRKLKDSNGGYLWQDSLIAGQPNTFSGYPVTICEAMDDATASNHPIAFGDFNAAYILCQIQGMTITAADQNITEPGFHKVYIRQRIGGCVYDENSLRFLKMAAS